MKSGFIITGLLVAAMSTVSFSQTATPKVDDRQENQQTRIRKGVKSGELTKEEAQKLRAQQRHVKRTENAMKSDGVVTPKERKVLDRKQDRASRKIARQKHDNQVKN